MSLLTQSWAYPALEVGHLAGIGLLLGNLVALEARVFGLAQAIPVRALARLSLGLVVVGAMAIRAFVWKMGLLMLAGCNAGWFHARGSLERLDHLARAQMGLSTVLWLAILACGRWIAYQ